MEDTAPYERTYDLEPFPEIPTDYLPDNVTVHFHFAPHVDRQHLEGALPLLEKADIFLPENGGWDIQTRRIFSAIARGDERKYRAMRSSPQVSFPEYTRGVIDAVYRRGKYIDFFDERSEEEPESDDLESLIVPRSETIEIALQHVADIESGIIFGDGLRRDRIMARNLGDVVTRIVAGSKPLRRKADVLVLATLGSGHIRLWEYLRMQEGSKDKVVASEWVGNGLASPSSRIKEIYGSGNTPTKADLLAGLVQYALSQAVITMPDGEKQRALPYMALEKRQPTAIDRHGIAVFRAINGDIASPRTQQFLLNLLNGDIDPRTRQRLHKYMRFASAQLSSNK